MKTERIAEAVKRTRIPAILDVAVKTDEDGDSHVVVTFQMYNDEETTLRLYVMYHEENQYLEFMIPVGKTEGEPPLREFMAACFHANHMSEFGFHQWNPDSGTVSVGGGLFTTDDGDVPDGIICKAVKSMISTAYMGHFNYLRGVEIHKTIKSGILTAAQADNVVKEKVDRIHRLLGDSDVNSSTGSGQPKDGI